jgi:FMN phosphatase YigB (HAD superfamily)
VREAPVAVEAITFDYWNTLVTEERGHLRGRRLSAWAGIFEDTGFALERQHLEAAFDATWQAYVSSWQANQQFLAAQAAVHCIEQLGVDVPDDVHAALVEAFTNAGEGAELHLTPHVGEVVKELVGRGVRLGIVCDVGFTPSHVLRAHLEGAGLLDYFSAWAFSDEVGVYKPERQIFDHVLGELGGVAPDQVAHVGDLRRTDVAGAREMGMVSVRYAGVFDDSPEGAERSGIEVSDPTAPDADHVITDHRQLPDILGL